MRLLRRRPTDDELLGRALARFLAARGEYSFVWEPEPGVSAGMVLDGTVLLTDEEYAAAKRLRK